MGKREVHLGRSSNHLIHFWVYGFHSAVARFTKTIVDLSILGVYQLSLHFIS